MELPSALPQEAVTLRDDFCASIRLIVSGRGSGIPWAVKFNTPAFQNRTTEGPVSKDVLHFHEGGTTSLYKAVGRKICGTTIAHGACCYVPVGEAATWSAGGAFTHTNIYVDPLALKRFIDKNSFSRDTSIDPFFAVHDPWLKAFFEMLHAEISLYEVEAPQFDSLLLEESEELLFHHLVQWHSNSGGKGSARPNPSALPPRILSRVLDYIESSGAKSVQLSDLANVAQLSENHLIRTFRAATGKTPYRYVLEHRLEFAAGQLRHSSDSVRNIATSAGFTSPAHFAATFKAKFGLAPTKYRAIASGRALQEPCEARNPSIEKRAFQNDVESRRSI